MYFMPAWGLIINMATIDYRKLAKNICKCDLGYGEICLDCIENLETYEDFLEKRLAPYKQRFKENKIER